MSNTIHTPTVYSAGISNFTRQYAVTLGQCNRLLEYMESADFLDDIDLLFTNISENVISIKVYPYDVKSIVTASLVHPVPDENIQIVNVTTDAMGYSFIFPPDALDVGTFTLARRFNNFLDFSPFTKIQIYLPYISTVEIDADVLYGHTINIRYAVDYITGECTAYIIAVDISQVLYTFDGKIGFDVQFGGGQGAEIANNILKTTLSTASAGIGVGVGVATGGIAGAALMGRSLSTLNDTAVNTINASKTHITRGGSTSTKNSFYAPQNVYLIITRPNVVTPASYDRDVGRPCGKTFTLGALTGFTVVDSIHVERLDTATSDEVTEVERLLKQGVIL